MNRSLEVTTIYVHLRRGEHNHEKNSGFLFYFEAPFGFEKRQWKRRRFHAFQFKVVVVVVVQKCPEQATKLALVQKKEKNQVIPLLRSLRIPLMHTRHKQSRRIDEPYTFSDIL
jgi:hypothetical protein